METSAIRDDSGLYNFARIGIPREPMEILRKAINLKPPILQSGLMSDGDPLRLRKTRLQNFAMRVFKAKALEGDELSLHSAMPTHLQMVLRSTRTLLNSYCNRYPIEMMRSLGRFERVSCFKGWLPMSNVFPSSVRVPIIHTSALESIAPILSKRILATVKAVVIRHKMRPCGRQYLEGPFDVSTLLPGSVISPRFGLAQRNTLRPIDNMSGLVSMLLLGCPRNCKVRV